MGNVRSLTSNLILSILITVLTGCATKPNFSQAAPPSQGKSLVYVYREKDHLRDTVGPAKFVLMMDGQKLALFRKATYLPFLVPPGKHKFEYRIVGSFGMPGLAMPGFSGAMNGLLDDHFLEVDLQESQTYYLTLVIQTFGSSWSTRRRRFNNFQITTSSNQRRSNLALRLNRVVDRRFFSYGVA
jgi:hypothetical protein